MPVYEPIGPAPKRQKHGKTLATAGDIQTTWAAQKANHPLFGKPNEPAATWQQVLEAKVQDEHHVPAFYLPPHIVDVLGFELFIPSTRTKATMARAGGRNSVTCAHNGSQCLECKDTVPPFLYRLPGYICWRASLAGAETLWTKFDITTDDVHGCRVIKIKACLFCADKGEGRCEFMALKDLSWTVSPSNKVTFEEKDTDPSPQRDEELRAQNEEYFQPAPKEDNDTEESVIQTVLDIRQQNAHQAVQLRGLEEAVAKLTAGTEKLQADTKTITAVLRAHSATLKERKMM